MATLLVRSRAELLCLFSLHVPDERGVAELVQEHTVERHAGGDVVTFADPVDALLGLRALVRAIRSEVVDLWPHSLIASLPALALLADDSALVREARAWLASWAGIPPLTSPRWGHGLVCLGDRSSMTPALQVPREIAMQELPRGLVLYHVDAPPGLPPIRSVTASPVRLGRSRSCELHIPDPRVSRMHLELTRDDAGWHVTDLESASGFLRNGERAHRASLLPGDVISVGGEQFVVLATDHSVPETP